LPNVATRFGATQRPVFFLRYWDLEILQVADDFIGLSLISKLGEPTKYGWTKNIKQL
jgi:hypothetical protein